VIDCKIAAYLVGRSSQLWGLNKSGAGPYSIHEVGMLEFLKSIYAQIWQKFEPETKPRICIEISGCLFVSGLSGLGNFFFINCCTLLKLAEIK